MNWNSLYTDPLCIVLTVWLVSFAIIGVSANYHRR